MDHISLAQFFISQLGHFLRMGTEKRPARQACFLFIEYTEKNFLFLHSVPGTGLLFRPPSVCLAEGVITLTAHPHPQKSAQTFTFQHRRIHHPVTIFTHPKRTAAACPERKVQFMPVASRPSRRETFIYASVSS